MVSVLLDFQGLLLLFLILRGLFYTPKEQLHVQPIHVHSQFILLHSGRLYFKIGWVHAE